MRPLAQIPHDNLAPHKTYNIIPNPLLLPLRHASQRMFGGHGDGDRNIRGTYRVPSICSTLFLVRGWLPFLLSGLLGGDFSREGV